MIFSILLILKRISTKNDFTDFIKEFLLEILKLEKNINEEALKSIKKEMGLPENWEEIVNLSKLDAT